MGLTSRSLEYVDVAAAVVCVGLTAWLWPRFAGRGPRALLGRLGSIFADPADHRGGARPGGEHQLPVLRLLARAARAGRRCAGRRRQMGRRGAAGRSATRKGLVQPAPPQGLDRVHGLPKGAAGAGGQGRVGADRRAAHPGREPGIRLSAAAVLPAAVRPPALPRHRRAQRLPRRDLPARPASAAAADRRRADPRRAGCSRPSS